MDLVCSSFLLLRGSHRFRALSHGFCSSRLLLHCGSYCFMASVSFWPIVLLLHGFCYLWPHILTCFMVFAAFSLFLLFSFWHPSSTTTSALLNSNCSLPLNASHSAFLKKDLIVSYICHLIQAMARRWSSYISPPNRPSSSLEIGCPWVRYYPNSVIFGQDCEVTWYRAWQLMLKKPLKRDCGHGRSAEGFQKGAV